MAVNPTLGLRLNPVEKAMLKELARRLKRSQTDTVRDLVRETLAILKEQDEKIYGEKKATQPKSRQLKNDRLARGVSPATQ